MRAVPTATDDPELEVTTWAPQQPSLRVAVVTETWPPEVNGVAATISRVVHGLHDRGHQIQLVRPRQAGVDSSVQHERYDEVLLRGLPIPRYPQLRLGLPARRALKACWALQRPDVVHLVTEGPLGWSALQAAVQLRLPVVSDFRTNFHAYSSHYRLPWLRAPILAYLRKFHNRTACTMVPTEGLRGELATAGFEGLRVVARGVDTRLFDPARRSPALRAAWGAGPADLVVLCVGRLAAEKNLGLLVQAFEAIRAQDSRARLVLVGDGPEREALQQRCPHAVFAGVRHGPDLAMHYASADLFVFPSVTETFGNVVPEAMASALPVLAFDYAAPGQLIQHGANGLLVPLGDEAAFVSQAARLAGQGGWVRAMGAQARVTARGLDWGRIVEQVQGVYAGAMAASGAPVAPLQLLTTPPASAALGASANGHRAS
jgi:glycosyltransferase involved in cell wall biosynthesis